MKHTKAVKESKEEKLSRAKLNRMCKKKQRELLREIFVR